MRLLGRQSVILGAAALTVAQGGCAREPPASPPAAHECPKPIPTAVIYHQAQDRWEVVLAPPDTAPPELPRALPLRTYTADGVVEGFVPNPAVFQLVFDRLEGPFPAWIEFTHGQWLVRRQILAIPKQPLLDEGFYGARVDLGSHDTVYTVQLSDLGVPIDKPILITP